MTNDETEEAQIIEVEQEIIALVSRGEREDG